MYKFDQKTDLSFLQGSTLIQICVGQNEIILNFDNDVRITMLASYAVTSALKASERFETSAAGIPSLMPLLGDKIACAIPTESGGVEVTFESNAQLELLDDSAEFESFWISGRTEKIIV